MGRAIFFTLPLISILFDCPWVIIQNIELLWFRCECALYFLSALPLVHTTLPALVFLSMLAQWSQLVIDSAVRLPGLI